MQFFLLHVYLAVNLFNNYKDNFYGIATGITVKFFEEKIIELGFIVKLVSSFLLGQFFDKQRVFVRTNSFRQRPVNII